MNKLISLVTFIFLFLITSQFTFANDCNNTKLPLDEYLYMEVDELNLKYCAAQSYQSIYVKMMNIDALEVCSSALQTIKRVLKKEYDLAPPDCETLFPNLYESEEEKKEESEPKPEIERTIQLPHFSSSSAEEKEPVHLYCECETWGGCRTNLADKVFIKLFSSENPRMEIGITPDALNYFESSPDGAFPFWKYKFSRKETYIKGNPENEYVFSKDGLSGTISPKSINLLIDDESYYVRYLKNDEGWFSKLGVTHEISSYDDKPKGGFSSGSFILNRKDLNLYWSTSGGTQNFHACEIVENKEFEKKLLKIVEKKFKSELKKFKKAKKLESKKAEAREKEKARSNKI